MIRYFKTFIRSYHPGYPNKNKLALPVVTVDTNCVYYNPVWGNGVQEKQLKNGQSGYHTYDINYYSYLIQNKDKSSIFVKTCHDQSIRKAINSCRKLTKDKYISYIESMNIMNEDGVFINDIKNREKLLSLINKAENTMEKDILQGVVWGIISNFGDSIYIANNYLLLDNNYAILCNYPDKASSREVERQQIVNTLINHGKIPIILDKDIDFEGEANIKLLPVKIGNKRLCLNYESTRSNPYAIGNINKYLNKLGQDELLPITLRPQSKKSNQFYHLDCIINFCQNKERQYNNLDDFYRDKSRGIAFVVKNSLDKHSEGLINKIFGKIIYLDDKYDNLIANIVVTPEYIVAGEGLSNESIDEIKKTHSLIQFKHPSTGGGGAHKCCSNVLSISNPISFDEYKYINKKLRE